MEDGTPSTLSERNIQDQDMHSTSSAPNGPSSLDEWDPNLPDAGRGFHDFDDESPVDSSGPSLDPDTRRDDDIADTLAAGFDSHIPLLEEEDEEPSVHPHSGDDPISRSCEYLPYIWMLHLLSQLIPGFQDHDTDHPAASRAHQRADVSTPPPTFSDDESYSPWPSKSYSPWPSPSPQDQELPTLPSPLPRAQQRSAHQPRRMDVGPSAQEAAAGQGVIAPPPLDITAVFQTTEARRKPTTKRVKH